MALVVSNLVLPENVKITVLSSCVEVNNMCKSYNNKYVCKILNKRNNQSFSITFHDSVHNWKNNLKLNKLDVMYSVIADMGCYEQSGSFEDFCNELGYNTDSITALKAYKGCKREYEKMYMVFSQSEIEQLQELFQDY